MRIFANLIIFALISSASCNLYARRVEDSDAAICGKFDICNLVHNPTWGINAVEKLCKCPEGTFCPATFSPNDGWSLPVNTRTQMKFCSPIQQLQTQLEPCEKEDIAIELRTLFHVDQVKNITATMLCSCEHGSPIYWKYNSREGKDVVEDEKYSEIIDSFQCSGL